MSTHSDDGRSSKGSPALKGFPYNSQEAVQDANQSPNQPPPSATKGIKAKLKKLFNIGEKSSAAERERADEAADRIINGWLYPGTLIVPQPDNILDIMHASPEHLAVLRRQAAQALDSGHVAAIQGDDMVVASPATDKKWSFDGNSMITYRDPNQTHLDNPGQNTTIPGAIYQGDMMPSMGNEALVSGSGPVVWSNANAVGAVGTYEPSFHGSNPSQLVHRPRSQRSLPVSHPIDMSNLRSPYEIAEALYVYGREGSKGEWMVYLQDYRAGQFNIITPPRPPPVDPLFSFLPAMDPLNEQERLASLFTMSRVWTPWQESRSTDLVKAAREEFGVPGVSISLIDNNNEILKAEVGYNRRMIKRSVSIAAHALLTTEVLVVLDTQRDWRFAKNPLVVGDPRIRFFAGAPILSKDGEVIGVFVIFGREPRDAFSALQRRSLTDYGAVCASDLNTVLEKPLSEQSLQSLQSQDNTENWDPSYLQGETKPETRNLWMHEETHRMLCGEPKDGDPEPAKVPKTFAELMEQIAAESKDNDEDNHPQKPPVQSFLYGAISSSAYSSIDVNFGTPAKERDAVISDYPLLGSDNEGPDSPLGGRSNPRSESPVSDASVWRSESPTSQGLGLGLNSSFPADIPAMPSSPIVRSCTPRPYSGSDLTSVDGNVHPNTPAELNLIELSPSERVQGALDHATSVLQPETPVVPFRRQRKKSIRSISKYEAELKIEAELRKNIEDGIRDAHIKASDMAVSSSTAVTGSMDTSGQPSTVATTPPVSFSTRMSTLEFASTDKSAEANAAAMAVAKKLGLNRVYVAELAPNNDLLTPVGVPVAGVGVRILASYNCPSDMVLDTDIHLQVLRSPHGAMRWHDKDAPLGATNKSLLIRLHSKGPYGVPRSEHTGGIVYGAIHVAQLENGEDAELTDQEQAVLVDAANEMKAILFRKGDNRVRKDSTCTTCNTPSLADHHPKPSPMIGAEGAVSLRSIFSPAIQTPKVEDAGPKHVDPTPAVEVEEDHPNVISVQSMQEAARAVAEVMKFNMDEEMSPQW
ncbi:hypothetical protein V494_02621 [Pseudogymnoascus sp. VKM F-4513 (FW-928)]|nr:hypothetical protein V494_02621 [Pseudogymnoascus sp. VKM F-4513 (FW-928)]